MLIHSFGVCLCEANGWIFTNQRMTGNVLFETDTGLDDLNVRCIGTRILLWQRCINDIRGFPGKRNLNCIKLLLIYLNICIMDKNKNGETLSWKLKTTGNKNDIHNICKVEKEMHYLYDRVERCIKASNCYVNMCFNLRLFNRFLLKNHVIW